MRLGVARDMRFIPLIAVLIFVLSPGAVRAVDPPYQAQMERLAETLGSLYFLEPLCRGKDASDWRAEMSQLIELDQPDDDRKQRLAGAFNDGYSAYGRLYRNCTVSASEALARLMAEAQQIAREIHTRYAE